MSTLMLNIFTVVALGILLILLIWETVDHAATMAELAESRDALDGLLVTLDRYRRETIEAQAIADHAIDVIAEAREITAGTIREARINELARAFIDRQQREQNQRDLEDEIDRLTRGEA